MDSSSSSSSHALMEEKKLMAEAKYRNYMTNIDKALKNFEYSSEWADLISALGKLSKAISSNTQYQVIPRRIKISKRLAQCMHPALPSGVHLKALETYAVIFSKIGPERLATELFIYSAGLFPLLGYAAMNVRPTLLNIYETYFVPLGEKLRPALSGFLSGVLPGYESGLDHFERTSSLLTQICTAVNATHFYTVLWECMAVNASVRLPAISYLLEHFNKRCNMMDQSFVLGYNRDIMISGLCACLNDGVILVQRNTLEFMLTCIPMHTKLLNEAELVKLVTNALNTILRRDMSLNRRLYSWLLGSEIMKNSSTYDLLDSDVTAEETYFEKFSRQIVRQALLATLKLSLTCNPVDLKPYRIMVSLLDKTEIGSAVLDYVLCDIIRTMSLSSGNVEVIKSANLLFATFDPAYIWSFIATMFEKSCKLGSKDTEQLLTNNDVKESLTSETKYQCIVGSGDPCLTEVCYLTEFLLETITLEMYNETTRIYLPKVFLSIIQMLTIHLTKLTNNEIAVSLKLGLKIISRVQPIVTSPIKQLHHQSLDMEGHCASMVNDGSFSNQSPYCCKSLMNNNYNLEKSKSDSKLNQFASHQQQQSNEGNDGCSVPVAFLQCKDDDLIKRSNSNQHIERKSPTKKKKAKSYSKLSELDKEICPDTGQVIDPRESSSDLDTPTSIKKLKTKTKPRSKLSPKKLPAPDLKVSEKHFNLYSPQSSMIGDTFIDEQPKSAPLEELNRTQFTKFTFQICQQNGATVYDERDGKESNISASESSILEKCIRQYEVFFEVYLSSKVLNLVDDDDNANINDMRRDKDKETSDASELSSNSNMANTFTLEEVYEAGNPCRLKAIDKLFETLKIVLVSRSKRLHNLLNHCVLLDNPDKVKANDKNSESDDSCYDNLDEFTKTSLNSLLNVHLDDTLRLALKLAVNLLVEMSTFPNCNKNISWDKTEKDLPSWLKVLCLVACYAQKDKELQLSAITSLFDLISLIKSQIEHTTSPGVTFVVMLPLMKFGHVHYIERHTRIFQLLTSTLWDYLNANNSDASQICSLIYQLHNCLDSGIVERIIDNRMFAKNMQQYFSSAYDRLCDHNRQCLNDGKSSAYDYYTYDRASEIQAMCVSPTTLIQRSSIERLSSDSDSCSFKKYELLWHLGRNKQQIREFEKLQFKILDTLSLPPYMSLHTCVIKWLQSALLRGDLSRLIKPLYKILLAPNTKRIGIAHIHLLQRDMNSSVETDCEFGFHKDESCTTDDISLEQDVYAISSEFGNIHYHTESTAHGKKRSPIRTFHKKIFGVTLINKNKTSNFVSDQTSISNESPISMNNAIGVIVNPLENSLDFDENEYNQVKAADNNIDELETSHTLTGDEEEEDLSEADIDADADSDGDGVLMVEDCLQEEDGNENEHLLNAESDSSDFDSESENLNSTDYRDDSTQQNSLIENYPNSNANDTTLRLKRFVGHCESVTELLSQHERTKNRKTYHLTRDQKLSAEFSFSPQHFANHTNENVHQILNTADKEEVDSSRTEKSNEYLDSKDEEKQVQNFVQDLMDQIVKDSSLQNTSKNSSIAVKKPKSNQPTKRMKTIQSHKNNRRQQAKVEVDDRLTKTTSGNDEKADGLKSNNSDSSANQVNDDETNALSQKTMNLEHKRRSLNLETSRNLKKKSPEFWELTEEVLEKGKQNLEILRQSSSTVKLKEGNSKGSSTKSCTSNDSGRIRFTDKSLLHLAFQHNMLVYMNVYDTKQTLYALHTLRNIIACDTRTFLCLSITTPLSSSFLKQLLTRHRKCIAGKGFSGSISSTELSQSYRGYMHLEVILLLCLFYTRSFFHMESQDTAGEAPTDADILGNCRVQLESIELLSLVCSELIEIVKSIGKTLAFYLADLMARCKLQKVILHCLHCSVNTYKRNYQGASVVEQIINFNNPHDDSLQQDAIQIQLLRLLMVVIKLEYEVFLWKNHDIPSVITNPKDEKEENGNISPLRLTAGDNTLPRVKYLPNCVISQQPMFLSAVLSALQNENLRDLHPNWIELVTASLNCFTFGSLSNVVISVIHQLCNNLDKLCKLTAQEQLHLPPDYVISQLEAITILCHYCLLDNTQQTVLSHLFNQIYPQTNATTTQQSSNAGQFFNSIVHSFLPNGSSSNASANQNLDIQTTKNSQIMAARNAVLSHLYRIVSCIAAVWDSDLGKIRQIKQQLMDFLSPISLHHGTNFLAAIAVTWQERGERYRQNAKEINNYSIAEQYQRNSVLQACPEQLNLVTLVSSIRAMPMDSFVQTLHQVVKTPPAIHRPPAHLKIEASALELFYFYMKSAPAKQLGDSWPSLLSLMRDCLVLAPPAQFTLLMLLNEFVQRCPQMPFQDKKDIRDLHDVTSRLVDSLSNVAGSCLEQTTWLRRNLAVKEDLAPINIDRLSGSSTSSGGVMLQQYSVQAQSILAVILANLLDVAYGSQEKDKVVSIITTLLYNITPYLKNHTVRNIPSFYACSSLLASLSGYQYTRKAWRKDMMDLLLDNSFFQMDISCLPYWKQIMDSLMTYDNTTFRELMSRVSLTQSGSLNIFTSREQEYEQRSMLLKRLAFVIFCSEFDQYHKYMPEIQEQLANSLRLSAMVPCVQAAVFLCFRVLLLRMSSDNVTSLWPIIIAEMVQVFLSMEQELKTEGEDLSQYLRMITGLDSSWTSSGIGNGITSQSQLYHWRSVQLEASKLLEIGCILPATLLPHFQMYRWAFVGTDFEASPNITNNSTNKSKTDNAAVLCTQSSSRGSSYVPHIRRIAELMDGKYTVHSPTLHIKRGQHLMLTCQQINSLQDLYSFFSTLNITCPNPHNYADLKHEIDQCLSEIEDVLSRDFLEKMANSATPR